MALPLPLPLALAVAVLKLPFGRSPLRGSLRESRSQTAAVGHRSSPLGLGFFVAVKDAPRCQCQWRFVDRWRGVPVGVWGGVFGRSATAHLKSLRSLFSSSCAGACKQHIRTESLCGSRCSHKFKKADEIHATCAFGARTPTHTPTWCTLIQGPEDSHCHCRLA